jgi:hypothetical protein
MATEYEMRPIGEMPPKKRKNGGLSAAVRALGKGEALFVPTREGETLPRLQARVAGKARYEGVHTRTDHDGNGIWVYRDAEVKA